MAFRRATEIRPTHSQALSFLAFHFLWQRQPDSAIAWADSATRRNPTNVLARQALGLVLIQQGRATEAEDDFAALADADTLRPSHHETVHVAWMHAEAGQRERAPAVLERFARPRHVHFQLHLREYTLDSLRREQRFAALLCNDVAPPPR